MESSDFIEVVEPQHKDFVQKTHEVMMAYGCRLKVESKATGLFAQYSNPKTKRSILNLFFRKSGLQVRIYPSGVNSDIIDNLPASMEKELEKATPCKRLMKTAECNPKCVLGYTFSMRGKTHQKCRYVCFQFPVTEESKLVMTKWIKEELK